MTYYGEKNNLYFVDNICETNTSTDISDISELGKICGALHGRSCIGCSDEKSFPFMFAFAAGAAESGCDVFLIRNTDSPSLRFAVGKTSSSCGVFFSEDSCPVISFYTDCGLKLDTKILTDSFSCGDRSKKSCGCINTISSFDKLYLNSISDSISSSEPTFNAMVSCGNRHVRRLWESFFNGDENVILQVSEDSLRVNIYSTDLGFISYERIILAYCALFYHELKTVYLPDTFHFTAEDYGKSHGFDVMRFKKAEDLPDSAKTQRFLTDPLFMCVRLFTDFEEFLRLISEMPAFGSAKREICSELCSKISTTSCFQDKNGKILLSRSGKNTLSLIAQARDSEAAAELCAVWEKKIRRLNPCTGDLRLP